MGKKPITAEALESWTTASLVLHLAEFARQKQPSSQREDALLVGAELNMRLPPRKVKQ